MGRTLRDQTSRKEWNAGGQFSGERSSAVAVLDVLGNGTDGGTVVHRNAAKKRHSAGPDELA